MIGLGSGLRGFRDDQVEGMWDVDYGHTARKLSHITHVEVA